MPFIFVRHAHSQYNAERRVNGDPSRPVPLSERGREEAKILASQLANLPIDRCICTRFGRTRETADIALGGRDVAITVEPLLDDINVGEMEGAPLDDYRRWKAEHDRADTFPGGESLTDAAQRYLAAMRALANPGAGRVLVVCHEIPIRYALNGASGSPTLEAPIHAIPNATPYLFDHVALDRAIAGIARVVEGNAPAGISSR